MSVVRKKLNGTACVSIFSIISGLVKGQISLVLRFQGKCNDLNFLNKCFSVKMTDLPWFTKYHIYIL